MHLQNQRHRFVLATGQSSAPAWQNKWTLRIQIITSLRWLNLQRRLASSDPSDTNETVSLSESTWRSSLSSYFQVGIPARKTNKPFQIDNKIRLKKPSFKASRHAACTSIHTNEAWNLEVGTRIGQCKKKSMDAAKKRTLSVAHF